MNIEYTGRSTTIYPKLKQLAQTELERIDKIVGGLVSAHVILSEDKFRMCAEITATATHETLVANCEDKDMEKALHDALRKIEQQAVKHKERRHTADRQAKPDSAEPLIEVASV